jgi:hypothetical protein
MAGCAIIIENTCHIFPLRRLSKREIWIGAKGSKDKKKYKTLLHVWIFMVDHLVELLNYDYQC